MQRVPEGHRVGPRFLAGGVPQDLLGLPDGAFAA